MNEPPPDPSSRATASPASEDPTLVNTLRDRGAGRVVFGRFRLRRELGAGGMAVVWLAQDERLGLEVALKFLPGMVASDPEALHDLRREITRGLRLTHPGIVRLYDLHEDAGEGLAAIAMEYVDGSTLADEKARQPQRCFEVAEPLLGWTRTLCEALSYVHDEAKVVHRDLKPRNIMLTAAGRLKVADFGIAATLCDSHSRLTLHPGSSGTPVYMSPQQALGRNPSVADDIYAIGATFYELLTSKPPFFRGNMAIILNQVASEIPPPMHERRTDLGVKGRAPIPPQWEETIADCLAKEPGDRPASVSEIAARLGVHHGPRSLAESFTAFQRPPITVAPRPAPIRRGSVPLKPETAPIAPSPRPPDTAVISRLAAPLREQATPVPMLSDQPQSRSVRWWAAVSVAVALSVLGGLVLWQQGERLPPDKPATNQILASPSPVSDAAHLNVNEVGNSPALSDLPSGDTKSPILAPAAPPPTVAVETPMRPPVVRETPAQVAIANPISSPAPLQTPVLETFPPFLPPARPTVAYRGNIRSAEKTKTTVPLTIRFDAGLTSGTLTEGSIVGDTVVLFSGTWQGHIFEARTGNVVSKPGRVRWDEESFTLFFPSNGASATYTCTAGGRTYHADLQLP